MPGAAQTIPRRLLGSELRRFRLAAGKSAAEAAAAINKDQSRISKVEDGRANVPAEDLAALLDLFGVTKAERKKLLAMGVEARKREPRRRAYVDTLPGSYRRRADMEGSATHISAYETGIFPGLLQHDRYAEAVVAVCDDIWWESSFQSRSDRVSFRLDRQRLVFQADPAKELEFIVTDTALRAEFGGAEVLRRQIEHVLRLLDDHPKLQFRLVPATHPDNPAPHGGFTLLRFPEPALPVGFVAVAYGSSPYLDDLAETEALRRGLDRMRKIAWSAGESRQLLERALQRS